jgi:amidohydrolase
VKTFLLASAALLTASVASATDLRSEIAADYAYIEALYKHFHQNPELSFKESETAKRLTAELRSVGFTVTEGVGDKWARAKMKSAVGAVHDGVGGYGVVAVMRNGDGPTVMLRADMDALPLEEKTGLVYASKLRSSDFTGQDAPVMHACAHDSHVAILIGAARRLAAMKDRWSGTLVLIGQPAEEVGLGAMAMLDDKLYSRFPKPDYVVALHTNGRDPAGSISYTPGYALANVDSVDITVRGVGAHGSTPHLGKDPIVIAAGIINALQTLVSRELDSQEAGVITVGSIQAGYKHNIIPDEAHLKITVRSYSDTVREQLLAGIQRVARAQATSAGLPENLMPKVTVESDYTPSTYNDPALTERIMGAVRARLGDDRVYPTPPIMGGEDFSQFGRTKEKVPTVIFWVGGADPKAIVAAKAGKAPWPPSNHSPFFAPIPEPTLKTGVEALTTAALELLPARNVE